MTSTRHPASFRDPSGFVFRHEGVVHRQVGAGYRSEYDLLMQSGLYDELTAAGLLIEHREADLRLAMTDAAYQVIRPEQLPLVSYPYEWCFSQLRDAALTTLNIQRRALAKGLSLKDASAYNIQLHGGRPVLIDTLSFERYQPGQPWVAYRQFCQHFLAPLALMSRTDVRLGQLLRVHLDGIPLDLASRLLPWSSRFSLSLGLHIHAHAKSQRKYADRPAAAQAAAGRFSPRAFEALLAHLESTVQGLAWRGGQSEWSDYYRSNNNYTAPAMQRKEQIVSELLRQAAPATVWDLGANDGRFGRLALKCGARLVVAWDIDPACVESNYRQVRQCAETGLLPLVLDLANPTPALGWAHNERMSLAERGPADCMLALGLVHHLAISNNVPLAQVAQFLAQLGRRLIVEWVPKHDSQVQKLLASRPDIFPHYERGGFERAFEPWFAVERTEPIAETHRVLYLMKAR